MTSLIMATLTAVPAGIAWSAAPALASSRPATHKYKGPVEDMRWGPVQVTIFVKNKKITNVTATTPSDRPRSQFINSQAIPMLRQEVLHTQSATIDSISGATMTSDAFDLSLHGAIHTARKHKDLK